MNALVKTCLDDIAACMATEHHSDDHNEIDVVLNFALVRSQRLTEILRKLIEDHRAT